MPDWLYRTVSRPVIFALPDRVGRWVALGMIGGLGRFALGRSLIDMLGHQAPDPRLRRTVAGLSLASPCGLGWTVDPDALASRGLSRFGCGAVEFGPVARDGQMVAAPRRGVASTLICSAVARHGVAWWRARLQHAAGMGIMRVVRLADGAGHAELVDELAAEADAFIADGPPPERCVQPWLRAVPWAASPVRTERCAGVVLEFATPTADGECAIVDGRAPDGLEAAICAWRACLGPDAVIGLAGGVREPADAVRWRAAGVDLFLLDVGMIFGGPGLAKRCNEAILAGELPPIPVAHTEPPRRVHQAAFWATALGWALIGGGGMALYLACSRVLLPYDAQSLGPTGLALLNDLPLMKSFLAHDRGTLAGVMLGCGGLYVGLARGMASGSASARTALVASALTGFLSFFWFLGFGYFDPFHAFVTGSLLPLALLALVAAVPVTHREPADVREDAAWIRGQWAQLLFVIHGSGLLVAGTVISLLGMSRVFVPEDLAFLCLGPDSLVRVNAELLPMVAHDRASLGGMLLASGVGQLLAVLWCWRRGRAWLWWALFTLGAPAYGCALGVHLAVGYTDPIHLIPAVAGAVLWFAGLALGRSQLTSR